MISISYIKALKLEKISERLELKFLRNPILVHTQVVLEIIFKFFICDLIRNHIVDLKNSLEIFKNDDIEHNRQVWPRGDNLKLTSEETSESANLSRFW